MVQLDTPALVPCDIGWIVVHSIVALGTIATTSLGIFLAHRRILADRDQRRFRGIAMQDMLDRGVSDAREDSDRRENEAH